MKKVYGIIALLVTMMTALTGVVLYSVQNYDVYLILENEGIAITDDNITRNLLGKNEEVTDVEGRSYEMSESVYVKNGRLYLGEEKELMSSAYPLFVNEGSTLFCLSDNIVAITEEFEAVPTYQGLYVSEGISFNQDMERAYRENFYFMELNNGLYVNAMEMEVKASDLPGISVSTNTILSLEEDAIRWYELEGEVFVYGEVTDLSENSTVIIDDTSYRYTELLQLLGLYSEQVTEGEENVPTGAEGQIPTVGPELSDAPTPTPTSTPTPTPTPTPVAEEEDEKGEAPVRPSATPTPVLTGDDKEAEENEVKPTKAPVDREWEGAESDEPLLTPQPPLPALPAEDAEPVPTQTAQGMFFPAVPAPVPPSSGGSSSNPWKKPEVKLGKTSAEVYTICSEIESVENGEYLHRKGIIYQVYEVGDKKDTFVGQKTVRTKGEVRLSGLKPDTEYKVIVTMYYQKGVKAESEVLTKEPIKIKTKKFSELPPIEVNWTLGNTYYVKKAEIQALKVKNHPSDTASKAELSAYTDMLTNVKKVEVVFKRKSSVLEGLLDKDVVVRLGAGELTKFKNLAEINLLTKELLEPASEYEFEFKFYDAQGREMPRTGSFQGLVNTCKRPPVAEIKLLTNEIKNVEAEITIRNENDADIKADSVWFRVLDQNQKPIKTKILRNDSGSWTEDDDTVHRLDHTKTTRIKFEELLDYTAYTIEVFADYDIGDVVKQDGTKTYKEEQKIGQSRIVTVPLSSLGYAYFDVSVLNLEDHTADVNISLDVQRTNPTLTSMLTGLEICFVESETQSGEQIKVSYLLPEVSEGSVETEPDEDITEGDGESNAITDETVPEREWIETDGESVSITGAELEQMKKDGVSVTFGLSKLDSVTKYDIVICPKVGMGKLEPETGEYQEERVASTYYQTKDFTTLKQSPTVQVKTALCMETSITLYDVQILDPDKTMLEYPVNVHVFDAYGNYVFNYEIPDEKNVPLIRLNNLEPYSAYTFRFYAKRMNNGYSNSYEKENVEIFYDLYAETEELLVLTTGQGLGGEIAFLSLDESAVTNEVEVRADDIKLNSKKDGKGTWQLNKVDKKYTYTGFEQMADGYTPNFYYAIGHATATRTDVYQITLPDTEGLECNAISVGYNTYNSVGFKTTFKLYLEDPRLKDARCFAICSNEGAETTGGRRYVFWTNPEVLEGNLVLAKNQVVYLEQITEANPAATSTNRTGLVAVRFSMQKEAKGQEYYAQLRAKLEDIRLELGDTPAYYLRVYSRRGLERGFQLTDYQMHCFANNGTEQKTMGIYRLLGVSEPELLETIPFEGEDGCSEIVFNYPVAKESEYRIEMFINVRGHAVTLGEVTFKTGSTIKTIANFEDLCAVKQDINGNYVVVNDIEIPSGVGTAVVSTFNGTIDFQGHSLIKNQLNEVFNKLLASAVLENVCVRFAEFYTPTQSRHALLAYYNYGTIRNLQFEYNLKYDPATSGNEYTNIVHVNDNGAVIENFALHLAEPMYFRRYGGMVGQNRGIIRNGYVYGKEIRMLPRAQYANGQQFTDLKNVGAITSINLAGGIVENCYSTVDVYCTKNTDEKSGGVCLLVGRNQSAIYNCFSTGTVYLYQDTVDGEDEFLYDTSLMPMYFKSSTGPSAKAYNNYLYSEADYKEADGMQRMELMSLYDPYWYQSLFNHKDSSVKEQFKTDMCEFGFYPHVVMPDNMPAQAWNPLPKAEIKADVELVNARVVEQNDQDASVVFTFTNPERARITEVNVRGLDVILLPDGQYMENGLWRVEAKVEPSYRTPLYYSEYDISGFSTQYSLLGEAVRTDYAESEYKSLAAEFFKPIKTVADWISIKNDLKQNYRLYSDLDFYFTSPANLVVNARSITKANELTTRYDDNTFSGKLDGNGHTIRNLRFTKESASDTNSKYYASVFPWLSGTISNLNIEGFVIEATSANGGVYRGLVGGLYKGAVLENIHVNGASIESSVHTGVLAGYSTSSRALITNCSVRDSEITSAYAGNNTQAVGGLVGFTTSTGVVSVENCFVDGLTIRVEEAYSCSGVGGIIGSMTGGSSVQNTYVSKSNIFSAFKGTGGIIGTIPSNQYFTVSYYDMRYVMVDADTVISSSNDTIGGMVGYTRYPVAETDVHAMFLGQVYSTNVKLEGTETDSKVHRFEGDATYTMPSSNDPRTAADYTHLYTSYSSYVEGALNAAEKATETNASIEQQLDNQFEFFSYEELCDVNRYGEYGIDMGVQYFVSEESIAAGKLPSLYVKDTDTVLPNQRELFYRKGGLAVLSVEAVKQSAGTNWTLTVEVEHPVEYTEIGLTLSKYLNTNGNCNVSEPECRTGEDGQEKYITTISYPNLEFYGYMDTYMIERVTYKAPEAASGSEMQVYINTGIAPQYKSIQTVTDWNNWMNSTEAKEVAHNIRIDGNLDFTPAEGKTESNIAIGGKVNRLIGGNSTKGSWYTIKGIRISDAQSSFIHSAFGTVKYLNFEDISITKSSGGKVQYLNLIGAARGDVSDLSFTDITIDGKKVVKNGLIGELDGTASNISMNGVTIKSQGDGAATGGLVGLVNDLAYVKDITATNMVVSSSDSYVGGIVGREPNGSHIYKCTLENFLVKGGTYTGGIAGYALAATYGNSSGRFTVKNGGVFSTRYYVGGIYGSGIMMGYSSSSTADYTRTESLVENVFVCAKGYSDSVLAYAGGVMGHGYNVGYTTVKDCVVAGGGARIGGLIGHGRADDLAVCENTVITTTYERSTASSATNDVYADLFNGSGSITDTTTDDEKAELYAKSQAGKVAKVKADELSKEETQRDPMVSKYVDEAFAIVYGNEDWNPNQWATAKDSKYFYAIGGAVGYGNSSLAMVKNCTIGALNAEEVGGIVGRSLEERSRRDTYNNAIQGGKVYGTKMVGGIVGNLHVGYVQSCYSDTTVEASDLYAAGVVGHVKSSTSTSYPAYITDVYTTSKVIAKNYAGGIFGYADKGLNSYNEGYLAAGSVIVTDDSDDPKLHPIGNRPAFSKNYTKAIIFKNEDSEWGDAANQMVLAVRSTDGSGVVTDRYKNLLGFENFTTTTDANYQFVTSTQMADKRLYTDTLTFSSSYFEVADAEEGYLPRVKRDKRFLHGQENLTDAVPIPGTVTTQTTGFSLRRTARVVPPTLIAAYASGVDCVNFEFDSTLAEAVLKIEVDGTTIAELPMTERCYSMRYDYRSDVTLTVTAGEQRESYELLGKDLTRNILTWKEQYYYLSGKGVEGSRATIAGSFVHLYQGKALAANGDIYDVTTGMKCGAVQAIEMCAQAVPFWQGSFAGERIETFYGYSLVEGVQRDGLRLFVKDGLLHTIDASMPAVYDAILIGGTEKDRYMTILCDESLVDMTATPITMPKDFENEEIWQMTNNLNTDSYEVLVRYKDGAVAGFNYRTGKWLPIETVRSSGVAPTGEKHSGEIEGTNFAAAYEDVKVFEENLIASGWEEVVPEESYATSYVEPTEGISGTPTPSPTPIPTPAQEDTGLEALEKEKDNTLLGGNKNGITEVLPEESGTLSGSGTAPEGAGAEDGTGATGEISGTDNQTTVTEQKPENNKEVVEESKIEKGKTFVPCFDPKSGEYVIYDVADLVSKREEKPVSMNEKVKRSGHMIEKYTPFSAEAFEENSDNRLGVMLFFATLTVIAGLVVILMIKQKSREDAEL